MALAIMITASLAGLILGIGVIVGTLAKTKKGKDVGASITIIGVLIALTLLITIP